MADTYAEIVAIKAEIVEYSAQAQKAAEDAEAAKRRSRKNAEEGGRALKQAQRAALTAAKYRRSSWSWWALMCPLHRRADGAVDAALATARRPVAAAETVER
ncbi:MAG: hypothetical protein ACLU9S_02190 [Oscillospiraceae bacterium]